LCRLLSPAIDRHTIAFGQAMNAGSDHQIASVHAGADHISVPLQTADLYRSQAQRALFWTQDPYGLGTTMIEHGRDGHAHSSVRLVARDAHASRHSKTKDWGYTEQRGAHLERARSLVGGWRNPTHPRIEPFVGRRPYRHFHRLTHPHICSLLGDRELDLSLGSAG